MRHSIFPILAAAGMLCAALGVAGCAGNGRLEAVTVLQHDQCEGLRAGLTRVDFAALAGIRGGTLLGMTSPETDEPTDDDLLLIAISRGSQPTPGYGLTLERVRRDAQTAVIEVRWSTPESGAMLAQVLTHPCLVVGLAAGDLERVEARDQHGEPIGSLTLSR